MISIGFVRWGKSRKIELLITSLIIIKYDAQIGFYNI